MGEGKSQMQDTLRQALAPDERGPTNEELKRLRAQVSEANANFSMALEARFPVGSRIEWIRAGRRQVGTVRCWGMMGGRLQVTNDRSLATFWIHDHDVMSGLS